MGGRFAADTEATPVKTGATATFPGVTGRYLIMKRLFGIVALVAALLGGSGCYTVPETGRKSVILTSPDQEIAMGAQSFAEMRKTEPMSNDPMLIARVQRVGMRIAQAVGNDLPGAKWEFAVFESSDVNAFALPGGKVGVYTGLLRMAESDDELATVIGHEIAHVTARHGAERMTEMIGAGLGGVIVGVATQDSENRDLLRAAYGAAAVGGTLMFSRKHESEADYIGLRYLAKAGYDPRAAVTFWQKMAQMKEEKGGARMPVFLSTHPSDAQRIADLQRQVPSVIPIYEQARGRQGMPVGGEIGAPEIGRPQEIGR